MQLHQIECERASSLSGLSVYDAFLSDSDKFLVVNVKIYRFSSREFVQADNRDNSVHPCRAVLCS